MVPTNGQLVFGPKRFRRNYLACRNCRLRKVRCDLGDPSLPSNVCARCRRERRACVFEPKKRRTVDASQIATDDQMHLSTEVHASHDDFSSRQTDKEDSPKHFSTMDGALVFLANAAGRMAADENKDNPNRLPHKYTDASETSIDLTPGDTPKDDDKVPLTILSLVPSYMNIAVDMYSSPTQRRSKVNQNVTGLTASSATKVMGGTSVFYNDSMSADNRNSHNHPGISHRSHSFYNQPNTILRQDSSRSNQIQSSSSQPDALLPETSYSDILKHNLRILASQHPTARATSLEEIEYIGQSGILSAAESKYFINIFFSTLDPFFPHIPKFLHLPTALCGYPLLLCTILTISTRYHSLEGMSLNGVPRNIEIHDRLWLHVQEMISRTVWAEASTRSIGTVFAFLLLTEWNPRAIHWRVSDYANKAEDMTDTRDTDSLATEFTINAGPEPAGLGAMRRSYRMAWMLIGSAVRLAQDMAFMELSSSTFVATHIAEINSVMNMKRRSMLSHSLAEIDLLSENSSEAELDWREESEYNVNNVKERDPEMNLEYRPLLFTESQRAQIELLQIISLGHESLYGYKAQLGCLTQRQNLAILNIMNPLIKNWGIKYKNFLDPTTSKTIAQISFEDFKRRSPTAVQKINILMTNESFIFDFNYTKLYVFSLALSSSPNSKSGQDGKAALKLDEISKSTKYIEQAFNSANEILQVAHRVHKLKMLKFMPVRWVTKIVRAVAFIVKCYLTITAHKSNEATSCALSSSEDFDSTVLSLSLISVDQIVKSIYDAAVTLRDCSPDELHLCTSYSKVLFYLYSEMKSTRQRPDNDIHDSSAESNLNAHANDQSPKESLSDDNSNIPSSKDIPNIGIAPENDLMDWFISNRDIGGLDFVGPWTELIEQQLEKGGSFEF